MKFVWILLVLMLFTVGCVKASYLDLVVSSPLLSNIKTNDEIVGVRTFLTLFAIKQENSKFVNYLTQLSNNSSSNYDSNRKLVMEWLKTNYISIGVMSSHVNYLTFLFSQFNVSITEGNSLVSNNLAKTSNQYFKIFPSFDSCQKRNYLEKYDAVLLDPYAFSFFVRFYRDSSSLGSSMMQSKNFEPIPLIPYEVYTRRVVEANPTERIEELFGFQKMLTCENQPDVSDAQYFRLMTGFANFSSQDLAIIQGISGKSLSANYSFINSKVPSILSSFGLSETNLMNSSAMESVLLSSSCYMCQTLTCAGENFDPTLDFWIIPQFVIIFGYFILLISFGLYKKPSMRRRIALPYCPILILTLMVMFTSLSRICVCIFYNISTFVIFWWVFIYTATVIRFYYLRNLYALITRFPTRERLMKALASEKSGFLLTVVLTFFMALILNLGGIYFFFLENKSTIDTYRASWVVGFIILGGLLGFIVVLWDMIIHGKTIRKFGLKSFFLFDDPLYVRVDMFLLLLPIIIAILVAVGTATLDVQQKEYQNVGGIFVFRISDNEWRRCSHD